MPRVVPGNVTLHTIFVLADQGKREGRGGKGGRVGEGVGRAGEEACDPLPIFIHNHENLHTFFG